MANKYSILIEAKLDPVASKDEINRNILLLQNQINPINLNIRVEQSKIDLIKTQIQNTLQNINVGINANVGTTGVTGSGGGVNSGGAARPLQYGPTPYSTGTGVPIDLQSRIAEIKRTSLGGTVDTSITETIDGITAATLRYTDAQRTSITETYKLNKETGDLEKSVTRLKDSRAADLKEIQNQIAKAKELANTTESITQNKRGSVVNNAKNSLVELNAATQDLMKVQDKQGKSTDDARERLDKASKATEGLNEKVRAGGKNLQSWTTEIGVAIKRTIEWAGAMTLLYGSIRQVEQGIQYVRDLNKELINIQLVTGETGDSIGRMANGFNKLAGELGSTTIEVARGSLEWARQGKTAKETAILLKDSTMMAKLANMDAAQSTEYMTSILNGFQLQAEDMMGVLDSLVALDNAYASSVSEISDAMQRSSNSARQSGISLETLASYITILSATTRKSSESIGESFPR